MNQILIIIYLMFAHWYADFVMQTDEMAKNKSASNKWLLSHVFNYTLYFWYFTTLLISILTDFNPYALITNIIFSLINGSTHFVVDYYTSRLNSKLWAENRTHDFFVGVGLDQYIHYVIMFISYGLLFSQFGI
jgi:uncharacterized membrane-anchored protein